MSLFIFVIVVLGSIGVAATIVIVTANNRIDDLEKHAADLHQLTEDKLESLSQALVAAVILNSNKVADQIAVVWDTKLADTLRQLTSEDTLAEALSAMSDEQMDRLADKTAKLREKNE